MKIVIPMAGMGKRMRPHTLTVPKPLIPIAGKPIVYRLVEDLAAMFDEKIEEIAFIIGDFGKETEDNLIKIANKVGAEGKIYYQHEPLGTAHAILCAAPALSGHTIVAFADTLFYTDFKLDMEQDGYIWTKRIENPSAFGVVETDANGIVKQLWEKPKEFVSDEAIIGIYYFRDGEYLKRELQYLIDKDIKVKGEYQLTDALSNMKDQGAKFRTATVTHWLDCGNKDATVDTNKIVLQMSRKEDLTCDDLKLNNAVVLEPCYIGSGVEISNSVVGPYVSIGNNTKIDSSVISNSIVMANAVIKNANLEGSMTGNFSVYEGKRESINLGDYSEVK
jgi:glucose-1-phosphate thymidylyltransferase